MTPRSNTDQMQKILDAIQQVAAGDYSVRIDASDGNKEMDSLAAGINEILENVCERLSEAEQARKTPQEWEAKYRRLEANIPGMVYSLAMHPDGSYSFPYVSAASRQLFHLDSGQIMRDAAPLICLIHPEDKARFDESLRRSAQTLQPWREEMRCIVNDEVRWYEGMSRPELRADGTTIWDGIILEITERKRTEENLRLTQFCVDHASIGIFRIDEPDGRIVSVNEQACTGLGYTREELRNMTVFDIDPTFSRSGWLKHRKQMRLRGSATIETIHRRKDGSTYPVEVTINYLEYQGRQFSFSFARDISERKQTEEALRASEEKYRSLVDNIGIGISLIGPNMEILSVNKTFKEAYPQVDFEKNPICYETFNCPPRSEICHYCATIKTFQDGEVHETITETPTAEGIINYRVVTSPITDGSGNVTAVIEMVEDITQKRRADEERVKLEQQLQHAQKMEAIGTLAGGIAHDFNNMLGVILGYAGLTKSKLTQEDPLYKGISEIERAANRSKDTIRQLLAFSRKQIIEPKVVNLNDLLLETKGTLARLIGENIELRVIPQEDLWSIKLDPSQFDQILVNLAVNARDAMPDGGRLTVETANVILDDAYCAKHLECAPGRYALLTVSDSGTGMDRNTMVNIFEPFFTTKEVGKGTGLGLSTVYGITRQNGGAINVYSEPGMGTTFRIYFPKNAGKEEADDVEVVLPVHGAGTVLLVEDDDMVRKMIKAMLEAIGYRVLVADEPMDALSFCKDEDVSIDLMITDVVMPRMSGKELRDRIERVRPGIKTLFMSGYTSDVIVHHGVLDTGVNLIQKPFGMEELGRKIRQLLGDH